MSNGSIEDALLELHIPRTAWKSPDEEYFDRPELDGRAILYDVDPITSMLAVRSAKPVTDHDAAADKT